MPDLGDEAHFRGLEGICVGDLDFDLVLAASVGRVGRRGERAHEVAQADAVGRGGKDARIVLVGLDVGELFGYTAISAARHSCVCVVRGVFFVFGSMGGRRSEGFAGLWDFVARRVGGSL